MFRVWLRSPLCWFGVLFLLLLAPPTRFALQTDAQTLGFIAGWKSLRVPQSPFVDADDGSEEAPPPVQPSLVSLQGLKISPVYLPLLQKNPRDLDLWLLAVLDSWSGGGNSIEPYRTRRDNLLALEKLFPRSPEVLAAAWVYGAGGYSNLGPLDTRPPGPSSDSNPNWSPSVQTEIYRNGKKYTDFVPPQSGDYQQELALVARGQKLEPQNAFWWQAQLHCFLGLRRDRETWAILRAGAQKTTWNDHLYEVARRQMRARIRYGLSRGARDDFRTIAAILFPHFARQRECARQVKDNCAGLHLLGQHQTAIRGALDMARIARLQRNNSKSYIGSLVGSAMMAIALRSGPLQFNRPKVARARNVPTSAYADFIGTAAKSYGFAALAREAWNLDADFLRWRLARWPVSTFFYGLDLQKTALALVANTLRLLVLAPVLPCVFALLLCFLVRRLRPLRTILRVHTPLPPLQLPRLVFAPLPALLLLLFFCGATFYRDDQSGGWGISPAYDLILVAAEVEKMAKIRFWFLAFVPTFLLVAALWRAYFALRPGEKSLLARVKNLMAPAEDGLARFDLTPLLLLSMALSCAILYFALLLGLFVAPIWDVNLAGLSTDYGAASLLFFAILGAAPVFSLAARGRFLRATLRVWSLLAPRYLQLQIVVCLVLWLFFWALGRGPEEAVRADLDRMLRVGETQMMRKIAGV